MFDPFALADVLKRHGQEHLLAGVHDLEAHVRDAFLERIGEIDWAEMAHHAEPPPIGEVGASRVVTLAERATRRAELVRAGAAAYAAGQVAVLMVAGGQGTRLGSNAPKGCFQIGPHSGKSIYQLQAEKVLSLSRRIGRAVPFLVMTSPMTDEETREFVQAHGWFGLEPEQVRFFSQGTVPSLDQQGRALLAAPGKLLENPDGHGGCFTALVKSGNLARLAKEGVKHLVYIQVDNLLAPVDDEELVGLAMSENTEVITKVLEKVSPDEKVGHLVNVGGRDRIIEYTEVTPEQARSRNAQGELIYRWGSPAMHCWSIDYLARLDAKGYQIPLHRSSKPLTVWQNGATVEVKGWKSERFIFDLLPEAKVSIGLEVSRADEFAPVKNANETDGKANTDSPATAVAMMSAQHAAWLKEAGVALSLPPTARIEISPLFAATKEQFLAKWDQRVVAISGDYYLEG
jgi:UDP-N-acetylglucosamine/UDP-N-acetylgalactosamine diphosphorylase